MNSIVYNQFLFFIDNISFLISALRLISRFNLIVTTTFTEIQCRCSKNTLITIVNFFCMKGKNLPMIYLCVD